MLRGRQIKAARALLGWSQDELAIATGLSATTIGNIESGDMSPRQSTAETIRQVMEDAGMEFIGSEGVKARSEEIKLIHGPNSCKELLADIYHTVRARGGDVVAIFKTGKLVSAFYDGDTVEGLGAISEIAVVKHIVGEVVDAPDLGSNVQFRLVSAQNIGAISLFAYGNKHAVMIAGGNEFKFVVFSTFVLAQSYREHFNTLWAQALPLDSGSSHLRSDQREPRRARA